MISAVLLARIGELELIALAVTLTAVLGCTSDVMLRSSVLMIALVFNDDIATTVTNELGWTLTTAVSNLTLDFVLGSSLEVWLIVLNGMLVETVAESNVFDAAIDDAKPGCTDVCEYVEAADKSVTDVAILEEELLTVIEAELLLVLASTTVLEAAIFVTVCIWLLGIKVGANTLSEDII